MTSHSRACSDVIIVGGAIIGSSIAYFLAQNESFQGSIRVIEPDPSYSRCSTGLSVGGIRQQFSTPENIEMSKFSVNFIKDLHKYLSVDDHSPEVSLVEAGYLFLATELGLANLNSNHELQKSLGVNVALLSPAQLSERFNWLNTSDLSGGSLGVMNEGWLDPFSLMMGFKLKAESLGVSYLKDEVSGLEIEANRVAGVRTVSGAHLQCDILVNAAGARSAYIAGLAGIEDLPVHSRKRMVYTFECRDKIENCPLVIDPSGVYFRPEGDRFVCGVSPPESQDRDSFDFDVEYDLFEEVIWPALANRVPAFEAIKLGLSWAGHYAYNIHDQNAVLGPHTEIQNLYFANGFSGHGVQQSPAVGRAISELIIHGSYQSLDLKRFAFDRFQAGDLVREVNVI